MEVWRVDIVERPKVLGVRNLVIALALHVVCFLGFFVYSLFHFRSEEKIIPIDLSVVVVENLDGNENEPPPLEKVEPEPPPPPPPPKPKAQPKPKEPEKPKELEKIVTNVVTKVEKKAEKKKPEPPKKTAKELREERLRKIRESGKVVNKPPKKRQPNGKTDKKTLTDAEIRKLLNQGYKPGRTTNLAASEEQRCLSLIKAAFEAKWDEPPWTDTLKPMVITCQFGAGGRLTGYRLTQSSGDRSADQTILSAAKRVGAVPGLSTEFIEKYRSGIPVRFTVKPQ